MSDRTIKISVALIACNGERYIAEQLQSLLDQTLLPDEIVISDDSRHERTYAAIAPFINGSYGSLIRYVRNPGAAGIATNTVNALKHCCGEYIFLCDQDDVWYPEKISVMSAMLDAEPEIDGVFCNSRLVDENLSGTGKSLFELRGFSRRMQKQLNRNQSLQMFLRKVCCSSHNIAVRQRALEYILPMPELEPFFCDTWIGLCVAALSQWRCTDQILTAYRMHNCNSSVPGQNDIAAARRARSRQAPLRNYALAQTLLSRCRNELATDAQVTARLKRFAVHQQNRSCYADNFLLRAWQIIKELISLRYFYCSNGWKSAIGDYLLHSQQK
ncbi:MAG: glycosyltransferase [Lentisphaerae bacterium]|nr:glycosyltransferase [Lentisphaerota bacterium]